MLLVILKIFIILVFSTDFLGYIIEKVNNNKGKWDVASLVGLYLGIITRTVALYLIWN